jgi:cob(I)alamin adenosyltransferase
LYLKGCVEWDNKVARPAESRTIAHGVLPTHTGRIASGGRRAHPVIRKGGAMKIYTKTGDAGETGLFGGGRVRKDSVRVDAYGEVDELNASLGLARSLGLPRELDALLRTLQEQLFTVGAVLATPAGTRASEHIPRLEPQWIEAMEKAIDGFETELSPMTHFILPGGSQAAAALHLARTVCRRAERRVVAALREGEAQQEAVVYLNRLSDLLFVMARVANHRAGVEDVKWVPEKPTK